MNQHKTDSIKNLAMDEHIEVVSVEKPMHEVHNGKIPFLR